MHKILKVNIIRCQFLPDLEKKREETFFVEVMVMIKILFGKNKADGAYALLLIGACQSLSKLLCLQHWCNAPSCQEYGSTSLYQPSSIKNLVWRKPIRRNDHQSKTGFAKTNAQLNILIIFFHVLYLVWKCMYFFLFYFKNPM